MLELRIQLLGDFQLSYGEQPLTAVNTARLQALLAYLVLHRDAPQSRKYLAFLFWPDTTEAQALTNLRNLLHKLRQALPDPDQFFGADAHDVHWRRDAPYTLDVAEFDALAQSTTRAELEQAARLYRGDLLPSCYDDWIVSEREQRQPMAARALARLIEILEAQRDYKTAIGYGLRLRQLDPCNEEAHRFLMRLHAANQDRAGVLRAWHTCVKTLQDELGADPAPETRAVYERLLKGAIAAPVAVGAGQMQSRFVGRQREWQMLQAAWRAAADGKPGCVRTRFAIISGEAGIGKTRLAEELLSWAGRQGVTVAAARCYAAEGALAYAPVVAWLRAPALHPRLLALEPLWATEAARLLPELLAERPGVPPPSPLAEAAQRQRLFEALARALLDSKQPPQRETLLLIDDLQWCDRDTLEWLRFLLRYAPRAPLLVVGTVRAEEAADNPALEALLAALRQDDQLTEILLAPLSPDETAALAGAMSESALTAEQLAWLHQESEGNPLFLVETMRSGLAAQVGADQPARPGPTGASLPLPPRVHGVLHARLAQLSAAARQLAGSAAAIGREFTLPVLARACDQDENGLVHSLDELWQRRIVHDAAGHGSEAYDFTHGKLREVAYNSLSAARRHLLHRRIAEAMEVVYRSQLDTVSGQIATHYDAAGLFDQAVLSYQRAAEAARHIYANADAIRFYRRGLALLAGPASHSPALSAELYRQLGDTLHWMTQYDEARAAYQQAIAAIPDAGALCCAELHRKIGNCWRDQYRYAEALAAYADAERALEPIPPEPSPEWWHAWIQVMLETNLVYYWTGKIAESDHLRVRLQPAVEAHGTLSQRAVYFQDLGWIEFRRNRQVATADTVALTRAALAAQQEAGNQAGIPAAQFAVGFALLWSGDPQQAMAPFEAALRQAEVTGDLSLQARCLTYLTVAHRQCGQIEETRRCAARALEVAAATHMPQYIGTAKANQSWLAWRAGDLNAAQELAHSALDFWHQLPAGHASAPFQWLARWPLIVVTLHEEQIALAVDHARALLDPRQQPPPDALAASLEQTIQAWDNGALESARALLQQSMTLAQELRYL
jgi:DNA-binding SARP family transcriptional activator